MDIIPKPSLTIGPNPHRFSDCGKFVYLKMKHGRETIIDAADYDFVKQFRWFSGISKNVCYVKTNATNALTKKSVTIRLHRLIMGFPHALVVDHINHNGLDNRRSNLRVCKQVDNTRYQRAQKGAVSKYKGVHWNQLRGRWVSQIRVNRKLLSLGRFKSEVDAALAYDKAAIEHFGDFAVINFKQSPSMAPLRPGPPQEGQR